MKSDNLEKIGVCVIGSGRAGMIHARNFSRRVGEAQLVALVDAHKETLQAAQKELEVERGYSDYRDALADPRVDAVVVVTPTALHREVVLAAAKAGKHVLCEKPMAMDVRECDDMIEACDAAGVKLQIGFMRRYDESFMAARYADRGGRDRRRGAGEIPHSRAERPPGMDVRYQSIQRSPRGGEQPRHRHAAVVRRGGDLRSVRHRRATSAARRRWRAIRISTTTCAMICRFADGRQGFIDGAVSVGYGYDARTEILGTKGIMFVGRREQDTVVGCSTDRGITQSFVKSWRTLFTEAYVAEDQDFVDCIRENREPRVRGIDGRMAVAVVNAGNRSIQERVPVKVEAAVERVRAGGTDERRIDAGGPALRER